MEGRDSELGNPVLLRILNTHSYSRRLLALGRKLRFSDESKNIPVVLPSSPIKI